MKMIKSSNNMFHGVFKLEAMIFFVESVFSADIAQQDKVSVVAKRKDRKGLLFM